MSEAWQIILPPVITIIVGTIVYALGHLSVALFVEPIHRLRSLIGEIADSLVFYAPIYSNPSELIHKDKSDEASEILRRQASQLRARAQIIPWYSFWAFLRIIRQKKEIENASKELIGLSNTVRSGPSTNYGLENDKKRKRIEELLGVRSKNKQEKYDTWGNKYCLQQGIILFLFTLLVFGLFGLDKNTFNIGNHFSLTIPSWFIIGSMSLVVTIIFMVAAVYKTWGNRIENFFEGVPRSSIQLNLQVAFWIIFMVVFIAGWLQSIPKIMDKGFCPSFRIILWVIGLILLFIIPIIRIKSIRLRGKREKQQP